MLSFSAIVCTCYTDILVRNQHTQKERVNNLVNGMQGVAWNSHGLTFSIVEDFFSGQEIHS
jgi:hypothetical protein